MRIASIAMFCAAALAAAGCDQSSSPASIASFDARCEQLPYARPEVALLPVNVVDVDSRSLAELTAMFERAAPNHQTLGLTQARIGHNATIELKGLQQAARHRGCFRAHVRVELFMQPVTVFVAREVTGDACRRAAVHEHEMKHVGVYEAYLREAAERLAPSLAAVVGDRVYHAADAREAQDEVSRRVTQFLDDFQKEAADELGVRQSAVDSPAEYARVAAACGAPGPMERHDGPIAVGAKTTPGQ